MDRIEEVDSYDTLGGRGRVAIVRRRSQFFGTALPLSDPAETERVIDELAREFPRASHHAFAYRVGLKVPDARYSDAGEPSGTAGMPLLQLLEGRDLTDCLVAVSRIFGGTLLGKGGLARAYSDAGRDALDAAGIEKRVLHRVLRLNVPYSLWGSMEHHVRNAPYRDLDAQYGAEVTLTVAVPDAEAGTFIAWVAERSGDSVDVDEIDSRFAPRST